MTEAQPQMTDEQRKELEEKIKNMSPEELAEFQKQQCIFCQIISGKIPSKKIYEDERSIAILDINPATKGHILLIPKEHYSIMPQIPDNEIQHFFVVAKNLSKILLRALKVNGTNIFVANGLAAGQRSQHFMIHVIPRKEGDGILDIKENLIDKEEQKKTKVAVENRLYQLLDIKKEVVDVQKQLVADKAVEEDTSIESDESQEENESDEESGEASQDDEDHSDDELPEDDNSGDSEDRDDDSEHETEQKKEGDVSLDDIAGLFK